MKNGQKRYVLTPAEPAADRNVAESVCAVFKPAAEQLTLLIYMFVGCLPDHIRKPLAKVALVA